MKKMGNILISILCVLNSLFVIGGFLNTDSTFFVFASPMIITQYSMIHLGRGFKSNYSIVIILLCPILLIVRMAFPQTFLFKKHSEKVKVIKEFCIVEFKHEGKTHYVIESSSNPMFGKDKCHLVHPGTYFKTRYVVKKGTISVQNELEIKTQFGVLHYNPYFKTIVWEDGEQIRESELEYAVVRTLGDLMWYPMPDAFIKMLKMNLGITET